MPVVVEPLEVLSSRSVWNRTRTDCLAAQTTKSFLVTTKTSPYETVMLLGEDPIQARVTPLGECSANPVFRDAPEETFLLPEHRFDNSPTVYLSRHASAS